MSRDGKLPYPGLRAFRHDEADIFFGREALTDDMVDKLAATRFLAVLGSSGSGKSSIVRTGLFSALELGLNARLGADWLIVDSHPGSTPFVNLAEALTLAAGGVEDRVEGAIEVLARSLRQSPRALEDWCEAGRLPQGRKLLVLIDQFEELFRFSTYARREEAEAFAQLLIESASSVAPIYIVTTMRSEYLGACSLIPGLAERINAGLYLTPRLTREQCREAIEGPARVCGFGIEPVLVTRLLNDMAAFAPWEEDDKVDQLERISRQADQLPLMQHVLNRLWLQAAPGGAAAVTLTLAQYERLGGLERALEAHGDEILARLGDGQRPMVAKVFRALVVGGGALAVRRPTSVADLVAIGGDDAAVKRVVDVFRAPDCNFLTLSSPRMAGDTVVDLSHESLIRQWPFLRQCADDEDQARRQWQRLSESADRYAERKGDLLDGLDLKAGSDWMAAEKPNHAWAKRYGNNFERVGAFLAASEAAEKKQIAREQGRKRQAVGLVIAAVAAIILAGIGFGLFQNGIRLKLESLVSRLEAKIEENKVLVATVIRKNKDLIDAKESLFEAFKKLTLSQAQLEKDKAEQIHLRVLGLENTAWQKFAQGDIYGAARYALVGMQLAGPRDKLRFARISQATSLAMGSPGFEIPHRSYVSALAFSKDSSLLAASVDGNVSVCAEDVDVDADVNCHWYHSATTDYAPTFSHDGQWMVNGSDEKTVRITNIAGPNPAFRSDKIDEITEQFSFSPDDNAILGRSSNGKLIVWRKVNGKSWTDGQLTKIELDTSALKSIDSAIFALSGEKIVVVGNSDRGVEATLLFNSKTGAYIGRLTDSRSEKSEDSFAGLSPRGDYIVTKPGDSDADKIKLWDVNSGSLIGEIGELGDFVLRVQFSASPDRRLLLATSSFDEVNLWDVEGRKLLKSFPIPRPAYEMKFSPDNAWILVKTFDSNVVLLDVKTGNVRNLGTDKVRSFGVSASGNFAYTVRDEVGAVDVWILGTRQPSLLMTAYTNSTPTTVTFDRSETNFAIAESDGLVVRRRIEGPQSAKEYELDLEKDFRSFSYSDEVGAFASSSGQLVSAIDNKLLVARATANSKPVCAEEFEKIWSLRRSQDRLNFALVRDSVLEWRNSADCKIIWSIKGNFAAPNFSADGKRMVVSDEIGNIRIIDTETGNVLKTISTKGSYPDVELSHDGSRVLIATNDEITLLDWSHGARFYHKDVKAQAITAMSWDRTLFAVWLPGSSPYIVNTESGQTLGELYNWSASNFSNMGFTADGHSIFFYDVSGVKAWDVASGQPYPFISRYGGGLKVSPTSGNLILSGSEQGLGLYDLETGRKLSALPEYAAYNSATFAPDGTNALFFSYGSLVKWDISIFTKSAQESHDLLCERLGKRGRNFTDQDLLVDPSLYGWSTSSDLCDVASSVPH